MAAARGRGLRPGGVVRGLGRLALLIGFGFAAGLFIGVLSKEPELLVGHLRGKGDSIALAPTGEAAKPEGRTIPEQHASDLAAERRSVMQARPAAQIEAQLPVVAASRSVQVANSNHDRPWAIQVGAFSDHAAAKRLAEDLGSKGYPAELVTESGNSRRWRVRVQPVRGEASANEMAARLKRIERLPTWVLPMEESPR